MNKNAEKWVKALRSGQYEQAVGALRDEDSYCCLGVACDLFQRETGQGEWEADTAASSYGFRIGTEVEEGVLPEAVQEWLGLADHAGNYTYDKGLASMNDAGVNFEAIAHVIASEPTGLFTES